MRKFLYGLAILAAISVSAQGQIISMSFAGDNGGGTENQILASESAGLVVAPNWNLASDGQAGSINDLINDSGVSSGASVNWSSNNTWGGTPGIPGVTTEDEWMVNGWLDDGGPGAQIDITGIPYTNYDVYVYGSSDAGNEGRGWTTNVNGVDYFSGGVFDYLSLDGSFFSSAVGFVDATTATNDPTYFKISSLSGSTLSILGARNTAGPALPNGSTDYRGSVSAIQIVENNNPDPGIVINRDTGEVSINNPGDAYSFTGYSLSSGVGALDEDNWVSISGNYDSAGDGSVSSDTWNIVASSNSELSENTAGSGVLASGASVSLGAAWRKFITEDITGQLLDSGGNVVPANVSYEGNGGERFALGDFNFDGSVDALDWPTVRDAFNSSFPGVSEVDAYYMGDLTGDEAVDLADLLAFEAAYDAQNGAGAFARLVPEPSAFVLFGIGMLCLLRRRGRATAFVLLLGLTLSLGIGQQANADLLPVENHSFENAGLASGGWSDCLDVDCVDIDFDPNWWVDDPIDTDNTGGTFTEVIDGFFAEGTHHLGMASGRRVKQTLPGVGLEPNTVYTFTVGVGNREGFGAADNASVFGLQVGGQPLADFQAINSTDIPVGTFVDHSWIYITGSDPVAGDIEVVVGSDAGGRGHFDNVRVDATPVSDGGNLLLLEIVDGVGTIKNGAGNDAFDIDYYEISSPAGSLNIGGWNSLEDQDYEGNGAPGSGNGWEELGNLDSSLLAEFYLTGSSVLAPGTEINLGNIWTGAAEDLSFNYHLEGGGVVPGIVTYDGGGGGVDGDFNDDGAYDCADIDALVAEIAGGTNNTAFDLNSDGAVDTADRDAWLSEAGEANLGPGKSYLMGDATLDGFVDVSDFGAWNANKFTATAAWCSGDFTADGVVDVSDFGAWNSNKFTASDSGAAAVPEPAGLAIMMVLGAGMLVFRRK